MNGVKHLIIFLLINASNGDVPQLWNSKYYCFLEIIWKNLKIDTCKRRFSSTRWMLNEMFFLLMLRCRECCLGSFVLGCIHLLSSWSWSAILFVPEPLPASTIQTHEGETLTRRMRRKPAHLGMTTTFKAFSVSQIFFVIRSIVQTSSTWKKIFYIFGSMCYLCFSGPWGWWSPRKMKWELAAAARRHVG